jgi:hypothetical protein
LAIAPEELPPAPARHTFVVLVGRVHRGVVAAVQHARSLRPDHIVALHIADDDTDHHDVEREWERFGFDVPLEIIDSPYRELVEPVERYLDQLDTRWQTDRVTVVIPEFVLGLRNLANVLHGQSGLALKLALLDRPNTAVLSVPFHLGTNGSSATASKDPSVPIVGPPRLTASHAEMGRARLQRRFAGAGGSTIADVEPRKRIGVEGEVVSTRVVPRSGSPWLEVTISDGTASIVAVFTGRRRVAGIDPGRTVRIEGVVIEEHQRRRMLNPEYTLLG